MKKEFALQELEKIKRDAEALVTELVERAGLKAGQILVVGCSTSEVCGEAIGKASAPEVAAVLVGAILPVLRQRGIFLAAQCCEHLNRALIVEAACAEKYALEEVCVVPAPKAGGSFATSVWKNFDAPVAVEHISAHAGLDIGGTLIGMHLRAVAVPLRLSISNIGHAPLIAAYTRPKYIGGERAIYS